MLKNLLIGVILSTTVVLTSGCVTIKQSRVPQFLEELNSHEFDFAERQTIGKILDYVNQLENQ